MVILRDLTKALTFRSIQLTAAESQLLIHRAVQELAERSIIGSFIVPLCFAMAVITSGYLARSFFACASLTIIMLSSAFVRYLSISRIKRQKEVSEVFPWLQFFFMACIGMAVVWGLTTAIFLYINFEGFPALLILILSVGIGAGSMVNFCIWRALAINYLILSFVPVILVGFYLQQAEILPLIIAVVFFFFYLLVQTRRWNSHFWDSLITAYLFERQAEKLTKTNSKLADTLEKEKELRLEVEKGKARIRELFNLTSDAIIVCALDGNILDVNQISVEMFPYSRDELVGSSIFQIFSQPEDKSSIFQNYWESAAITSSTNFESMVTVAKKQEPLFVQVNLRRVTWQKEQIIFVTLCDITVRKQMEDALKITQKFLSESEGYLHAILGHIELPIYCKDLAGCYLTVNKPFEQLCCRTMEELHGKNDLQIFPENIGNFFNSKDSEMAATGKSFELEGNFLFDGQEKKIFVHKFPLKKSNGAIYATAGICTDVSSMKEALHAAQLANEAKAEFLAGMSHELRTPIHSILSIARLGLKRVNNASPEKLETYFSMIVASGDQLLELLSDLLELGTLESAKASYNLEECDLARDLEKVVDEFKVMMAEREITLQFEPPGCQTVARYDKTRIYQVLRNLLANAMKFTAPQKEVKIVILKDYLEIDGHRKVAWKVMVIDQGIGIQKNELKSVFGKFVKGSASYSSAEGVGLGLSICKRIIEDHHGIIWAEQNDPEGTAFCFLLPAVEEP